MIWELLDMRHHVYISRICDNIYSLFNYIYTPDILITETNTNTVTIDKYHYFLTDIFVHLLSIILTHYNSRFFDPYIIYILPV